jgi:hypothetical protein
MFNNFCCHTTSPRKGEAKRPSSEDKEWSGETCLARLSLNRSWNPDDWTDLPWASNPTKNTRPRTHTHGYLEDLYSEESPNESKQRKGVVISSVWLMLTCCHDSVIGTACIPKQGTKLSVAANFARLDCSRPKAWPVLPDPGSWPTPAQAEDSTSVA